MLIEKRPHVLRIEKCKNISGGYSVVLFCKTMGCGKVLAEFYEKDALDNARAWAKDQEQRSRWEIDVVDTTIENREKKEGLHYTEIDPNSITEEENARE